MHQTKKPTSTCRGFTLVELLVVIGIIVILIGILIPVVSKARTAARTANTTAFISNLSRAIDAYYGDFRAYPGPWRNEYVYNSAVNNNTVGFVPSGYQFRVPSTAPPGFDITVSTGWFRQITMSECLVLSLLGGLRIDTANTDVIYDPSQVGGGAMSLNTVGTPKRNKAYVETQNLSWRETSAGKTGHYVDDAGAANDTIIPEFVDQYIDPMPILYMRASVGASAPGALTEINNTIVTYDDTNTNNRAGQYDLHQIMGYTGSNIGVGRKSIKKVGWSAAPVHGLSATSEDKIKLNASLNPSAPSGLTYKYPYDAYPYLRNQSLSTPKEPDANSPSSVVTAYTTASLTAASPRNDVPHQKDAYILISAGPDRIYGTSDDITNFGDVGK